MAAKSFARAKDGFHAAAVLAISEDERQALRFAALGQLSLARRLIEEIEQRNAKYRPQAAIAKRARRAQERR